MRSLRGSSHAERCAAPRAPEGALEHCLDQDAPAAAGERPSRAGGFGGGGTPGPVPNPEVKPASAEGTAGATPWEARAPPAREARTCERGPREGPFLRLGAFVGDSRDR